LITSMVKIVRRKMIMLKMLIVIQV